MIHLPDPQFVGREKTTVLLPRSMVLSQMVHEKQVSEKASLFMDSEGFVLLGGDGLCV